MESHCTRGDVAVDELHRAVGVARAHGSRSLELRATSSLAEALAARGQGTEAQARLAAIYEALPEGRDTPDHAAARALLAKLSTRLEAS